MIRRAWQALRPFLSSRARLFAALLAVESLVAGLLEAVLLVLVVSAALSVASDEGTVALDVPFADGRGLTPGWALIIAACVGVAALVVHLQVARLTAHQSASVLRVARDRMINAFSRASSARQAEEREGAVQDAVSTLATGASAAALQLSQFASASLALVALLAAAIVVNPLTTVAVLLFGVLLFAIIRPISLVTRKRAQAYVEANSRFVEDVGEWTSLALELRTFGVDGSRARVLGGQNQETFVLLARTRFISRAGSALYRDIATLFLVGAVGLIYLTGSAEVADVGAIVLLIVRAMAYAQNANAATQGLHEVSPNLDLLAARIARLEEDEIVDGTVGVDAIGTIELHGVGYDYHARSAALRDVTFTIEQGRSIGIVGPSGGGKTTLVQLLLHLREPTAGRITVDGVPVEQINEASWRRKVALVPQEPRLFSGTVADNIRFFREGLTDDDVEEAAAAAQILDEVRRLPDGFDTLLGPRGTGLSGGQRQRIAIARALVGRPQVLVLDEPTSALDQRSEELFKQSIAELHGRITMVIVAHRLSTLASCDQIIGIERGRVTAIGDLPHVLASLSDAALLPDSGPAG